MDPKSQVTEPKVQGMEGRNEAFESDGNPKRQTLSPRLIWRYKRVLAWCMWCFGPFHSLAVNVAN